MNRPLAVLPQLMRVAQTLYTVRARLFIKGVFYKIQKNKYGTLHFEWCDGGIIIDDVYESQLAKFNG